MFNIIDHAVTRERGQGNTSHITLYNYVIYHVGSVAFAVLGFVRLTFAGAWLAYGISKVVLLNNSTQHSEGLDTFLHQLFMLPTAAAVLGGLEMTITFFICCAGCCGMTSILVVVVIVVSVLNFVTFVLTVMACAQVMRIDDFVSNVTSAMLDNFLSRYANVTDRSRESKFTLAMDVFQVHEQCCGVLGYEDYGNASLWKTGVGRDLVVPATCCKLNDREFFIHYKLEYLFGDCTTAPNASTSFMDTGCAAAMMEDTKAKLKMTGIMLSCVSLAVQMLTQVVFIIKIRTNQQRQAERLEMLNRGASQVLREVHTKAVEMGNKHRMSDALDGLSRSEVADTICSSEQLQQKGTLTLVSTLLNASNDPSTRRSSNGSNCSTVSTISSSSSPLSLPHKLGENVLPEHDETIE